jgi:hypothetical protein
MNVPLATFAKRIAVSALVLLALLFMGDYVWLRYRIAHPNAGKAFGTVQMERLYAIPQKNGKTEYEFDARQPEVTQKCVHSLFPHMGYSTCSHLFRDSQKPIPMIILPRSNRLARGSVQNRFNDANSAG